MYCISRKRIVTGGKQHEQNNNSKQRHIYGKDQHMTSAFKMDEKNNDWRDSSVPSDRFYDDFDLQFDFLKQDSVANNFFYYKLAIKSPQQIRCDIYSARVNAVDNGE